ncbi:zinc ribbon domain-containing protein [Halovenus salina]|uniref:Zinc-ribbon domain-containing protein n=1 Tax=Halovenus salina TaxID=1510225 RepID=A0ABD5W2W4_9EURY|nr:hypothetical protein [Halovenus salina]
MAICSNCGETAGPGRSYCPSCGAELPEEGDEPAEREPRGQQGNGESDRSQPDRESHNGGGESDRRESPRASERQSGTRRGGRGSTPGDRSQGGASRDASSQPNRDAHSGSSERDTPKPRQPGQSQQSGESSERDTPKPRQPRQSQQSGGQSGAGGNRGGAGSGGSLLGTSGQAPSEPDVNDILWKIGWSPIKTIVGFGVLFVILAVGMEMEGNGIGGMTVVGLVIGSVVWYFGVREVNEHYAAFRDAFFASSANRAESRLGIDRTEVIDAFNFRSHSGSSPFLVEPSKNYLADHMVLSDVSVSVDLDSEYNMKGRDEKNTGTTINIYYDNIETITTNDELGVTNLRIVTSRGENISGLGTVDQRVAEEAQARLRSKMRDERRARR